MNFPDLSTFERTETADWYLEAKNQLKGKNVLEEISWESFGIKNLKPYYDNSDLSSLSDQVKFFQALPRHAWKLFETVSDGDEKIANKKALDALTGGCDGIIFEITPSANHASILHNIDLEICEISIDTPFKNAKGMNLENCLSILDEVNPVGQIRKVLEMLNESHEWIRRNSFSDFFMEVATIRALRYLLNTERNGERIKIHSSISNHVSEDHQWFLNTTAGLASILGGSYSIDFPTAIGDPRISRNVGNIIREESGIDNYEDQCGGSFFVESLTYQLIKEVKEG